MGAGGGGGGEQSPERWEKVGAARAGAWRWLGGRVLERKARVGPPVSSHHRPNCHLRPSPEGAGPSPPPPGIPRGGGSSSSEGPHNYLLSPVNPSSVEGPSLLTPLVYPARPAPQPWGGRTGSHSLGCRPHPRSVPPGRPDIPPCTCPCSLEWDQS